MGLGCALYVRACVNVVGLRCQCASGVGLRCGFRLCFRVSGYGVALGCALGCGVMLWV